MLEPVYNRNISHMTSYVATIQAPNFLANWMQLGRGFPWPKLQNCARISHPAPAYVSYKVDP